MIDYYRPPWRNERAPYGVVDAHALSKLSCETGYLARGFLDMNKDLKISVDRISELTKELKAIKAKSERIRLQFIKQIKRLKNV
jgi:hypothetical protein